MLAYKLFKRRKDGTIGPLFINKKQIVPVGQWLTAESHPTKGYTLRPGWHTCSNPEAKHLSTKDRVWMTVEIEDFKEFKRPKNQGGVWFIANKMKVIGLTE